MTDQLYQDAILLDRNFCLSELEKNITPFGIEQIRKAMDDRYTGVPMTDDPSEPDPESRAFEQEEYEKQREAKYRQRSLVDLRDRLAANLFRDLFNLSAMNGNDPVLEDMARIAVKDADALMAELQKR